MKNIIIPILYLHFCVVVFISCKSGAENEKIKSDDTSVIKSFSLSHSIPDKFTNNFEGEMLVLERSLFDTNYYRYYVKGKYIRIDELKDTQIINTTIINLLENKIIRINPFKKMYVINSIHSIKTTQDSFIEIKNTHNYKYICGEKCSQWRIKNKNENFEFSYWISESKSYNFFYYFSNNFKNGLKHLHYFTILPDVFGKLPFEISEYTTLRDFIHQFKVIKVNKTNLDTSLFTIYKNLTLYY